MFGCHSRTNIYVRRWLWKSVVYLYRGIESIQLELFAFCLKWNSISALIFIVFRMLLICSPDSFCLAVDFLCVCARYTHWLLFGIRFEAYTRYKKNQTRQWSERVHVPWKTLACECGVDEKRSNETLKSITSLLEKHKRCIGSLYKFHFWV